MASCKGGTGLGSWDSLRDFSSLIGVGEGTESDLLLLPVDDFCAFLGMRKIYN